MKQRSDDYPELVGRIYEAVVDADLWPSVLDDLARSVDAIGGALLAARNDRWAGWRYSPGTPRGLEDYLRSDGPARSRVTTGLVQVNRAGFVPDQDVLPDAEWLADPLMTEWATAAGLHHAAATAIHVPNGDLIVIHLHRRTGLPRFDADDLARLDAFRPHLARASMLAARWRLERLRAAADALELVGLPAAVVDARGRVLAANGLIQRTSPWTAWLPGDRVALVDSDANDMLRRAFSELGDPVAASVRSIPVRAHGETDAAVIHIVPAVGRARDVFNGALGVLVITPVKGAHTPAPRLLQALFDLTPAEANIAKGIAEGSSLEQLASEHGVSVDTVRAQAKAVFSKTGTHRQAQVVALLSGLAKIPEATQQPVL